jgi:FKBP-type peptidyl-prolyl cis-trans isomerase 2
MEKGDWIRIDFVGRVKATGEVFDLTRADDAKSHGIHDEKKKYGPALVIVGAGMIVPGLEKALGGMITGDEKTVALKPSEAFGPRDPKLIRVISMPKFIKEGINPVPNAWINIDGRNCLIRNVAGGRVMVDFNEPLAGKEVEYWVKVVGRVDGKEKRTQSLLEHYGIPGTVEMKPESAEITTEKELPPVIKKLVEEMLHKWAGIKQVVFSVKEPKKKADEKSGAPKSADAAPAAKDAEKAGEKNPVSGPATHA